MNNKPTFYILKDRGVVSTQDAHEWFEFYQDFDNRLVKKTQVGDYEIVTVFVGISKCLLFETTVFNENDVGLHEKIWIEKSRGMAEARHQIVTEYIGMKVNLEL